MNEQHQQVRVEIPKLMSYEEVANILGVSVRQVERYVKSGELSAVLLSPRKRRVTADDFSDFVKRKIDRSPAGKKKMKEKLIKKVEK